MCCLVPIIQALLSLELGGVGHWSSNWRGLCPVVDCDGLMMMLNHTYIRHFENNLAMRNTPDVTDNPIAI
jgi:hypothetical protein